MSLMDKPSAKTGMAAIGEPSLRDVLERIAGDAALAHRNRVQWSTSLRQTAGYLERPLELIPARMAVLGPAIAKLHPQALGVNSKTFANHRSNLRAAVLWFNGVAGIGRNAPMDPRYRALWDRVPDRYGKNMLSPFFRHLGANAVAQEAVSDGAVQAYADWRQQTGFGTFDLSQQRALVRHWNSCAGTVSGWPRITLTEPALLARTAGPEWEAFPPGLRADIDAYCARIAKRHRTAGGRMMRPCKPGTIETRRRELIAAVRAAVTAGVGLEELTSLRELLRPDRVETVIEHYWKKNGEEPSLYTIDLGWKLLALARQEPEFDPADLERLDEIRMTLDQYREKGLTEKNRELVRKVIRSDSWRTMMELPDRLMADARRRRRANPLRAAVTAQLANAILILIFAPVRMDNLVAIRLGTNLVRPGGPGRPFNLQFPDYDVKNRMTLEFELSARVTALIDEYANDFRPQLMRGRNHDLLFPGTGEGPKGTKTLSEQISERIWKTIGLKITAHQFRHAAAALILQAEPGNYELVRRVLGHRNLQTTKDFYIGLESIAATRRFAEIVTGMGEGQHV